MAVLFHPGVGGFAGGFTRVDVFLLPALPAARLDWRLQPAASAAVTLVPGLRAAFPGSAFSQITAAG